MSYYNDALHEEAIVSARKECAQSAAFCGSFIYRTPTLKFDYPALIGRITVEPSLVVDAAWKIADANKLCVVLRYGALLIFVDSRYTASDTEKANEKQRLVQRLQGYRTPVVHTTNAAVLVSQ